MQLLCRTDNHYLRFLRMNCSRRQCWDIHLLCRTDNHIVREELKRHTHHCSPAEASSIAFVCGVPTWLWAFSSLKTANCWYFVCMKSRHSSALELWSILHLSVALSSTHQVHFIGAHSLTLHVMQDNSTLTFLFYLLMYVLLFCARDSSKLPSMHIPVCIDCQWQIRSLKISPTCTLGHLAWASSLPWNSICTW
jgi:hypothetical protein